MIDSEDTDELSVPDCRQCQCGMTTSSQCCSSESDASCCGCYAFEKMSQSDLRKDPEDQDNTTSSYSGHSGHSSRTSDWHGHLLFEFFESSPPYARVPFSDKVLYRSRNSVVLFDSVLAGFLSIRVEVDIFMMTPLDVVDFTDLSKFHSLEDVEKC
mgnify:CR=1 FL=1